MYYYWQLNQFLTNSYDLPIYMNYFEPGTHPALWFFNLDSSKIVFIISGEAEHVVIPEDKNIKGNKYVKIKAGDVLIIHPGCTHAYYKTENLELYNLVYDRRKLPIPLLDGYAFPLFYKIFPLKDKFTLDEMSYPAITLTAEEIAEIRPMLDKLLANISNYHPGGFYESLGIFMHLTHTLGKMRMDDEKKTIPSHQYRIGDAIFLIERDFFKSLTIDDMAQSVNMSRRNFCRYFRRTTGTSPLQYLLAVRINRAVEMLRNTDLSVEEIAIKCGFNDENYFRKVFKKIKHESPGKFRKKM